MREKSKIKKEKYHNKVLEMKIILIINRQTFDKKIYQIPKIIQLSLMILDRARLKLSI